VSSEERRQKRSPLRGSARYRLHRAPIGLQAAGYGSGTGCHSRDTMPGRGQTEAGDTMEEGW